VVDYATLWFAEQLCDVGIRFFRYVPGFMHQKVFLLDDNVSTVGSANFDNRSFRLQFEINAVFFDESFAGQIEAMLERDLERCRAYDPLELREASFAKRVGSTAPGAAAVSRSARPAARSPRRNSSGWSMARCVVMARLRRRSSRYGCGCWVRHSRQCASVPISRSQTPKNDPRQPRDA
jgi:phosphatidylserine/phosphatidylglycerophosphate/cardiolipin synthase-like enzyme